MYASLSNNTMKQYDTGLKRWFLFCQSHSVDLYEASVPNIIYFLTKQFNNGAQYGTLNSYRSALSLIIGSRIGTDDRIIRLFKGFYKLRPPLPRYNETWNPSIVLNYLSQCYPNDKLDLECLTKKTVALIALVTAHRVQTISKINIKNISVNSDHISIKIPDLIKTSRIGSTQPCLHLPFFSQQPEICPAEALRAYISKTQTIRGAQENLFISYKSPYNSVNSQTLSRWIKNVLCDSGVDTSKFKAHSTRHASTSAALRSGVSIDLIRKTAGWSGSSSVFARFYQRPVLTDNANDFAVSVLES
nr:uncharacterized protein LOC126056540 [Helicoverpa armigera]